MATTTNYGWTTPDDTALVKDGAAAIRTLGSSVDTTTKALNPSTTLGDVEYRSSTANTNTRLGIGTTGQVLTVTGGVPAWATISAGGMTSLASGSLSSTAVNLTGISGSYKQLVLYVHAINVNTATPIKMRFNNDSGSNYCTNLLNSDTTSVTADASADAFQPTSSNNLAATSGETNFVLTIPNYTNTSGFKIFQSNAWFKGFFKAVFMTGAYLSASAITEINITTASGTATLSGTYTLYGVN